MKLLVIDVEGTLFKTEIRLPGAGFYSTIWQAIARQLGPQAELEEVETQKKWKCKESTHFRQEVRVWHAGELLEACFLVKIERVFESHPPHQTSVVEEHS